MRNVRKGPFVEQPPNKKNLEAGFPRFPSPNPKGRILYLQAPDGIGARPFVRLVADLDRGGAIAGGWAGSVLLVRLVPRQAGGPPLAPLAVGGVGVDAVLLVAGAAQAVRVDFGGGAGAGVAAHLLVIEDRGVGVLQGGGQLFRRVLLHFLQMLQVPSARGHGWLR